MKRRTILTSVLAASLMMAAGIFAEGGQVLKGNPDSKIYHKSGCQYYSSKGATVEFKSEAEAQKAGYKPCKKCFKAKGDKKCETKEKEKSCK